MANQIKDNKLYRFRPIENLLSKRNELRDQSIFFAPPHKLNDPAEGFIDVYFKGDKHMWESLFTNYLFSLTDYVIHFLIFNEDDVLEQHPILTTKETAHENLQQRFDLFIHKFIKSEKIQNLISNIIRFREKVSQPELTYYLSSIHFFALQTIFDDLEKDAPNSTNFFPKLDTEQIATISEEHFDLISKMEEKYGEDATIFTSEMNIHFLDEMSLMLDLYSEQKTPNKKMMINGFPSAFSQKLIEQVYPTWFTACFMSEATNSSIWGSYAVNHTGACLIFESEVLSEERKVLGFTNGIIGYGKEGHIRSDISPTFDEIDYTNEQVSINFFDSLGMMPIGHLQEYWFKDSDGNYSSNFPKYDQEWRDRYWSNFKKSITKKTIDWKYENEFRLIINNMMGSYPDEGFTLNYSFKSLKGIIFGIKTSTTEKQEIIRIIHEKQVEHNHYDFEFYQAYFCRRSGEIKHKKMGLIKNQLIEKPILSK